MKKRYISILAFAALVPALMSHHNGVAEEQNKDRTGAPGSDNPCSQCHSAGEFSPISAVAVLEFGTTTPITEYVPGETYTLQFGVGSTSVPQPSVYGFQATAVLADGANAGTFQNPGAGVQLEDVGGRHIIEHSVDANLGLWSGDWVAPATGSGEVTFYMSGVACNDNGTSGGDGYDGATFTVTEVIVSVDDLDAEASLIVNNTGQAIEARTNRAGQLMIFNLGGQLVHEQPVQVGTIDLGRSFDAGVYVFKLVGKGFATERKVAL